MAAINARAYGTASALIKASRTLRWVGIHAFGHALQSWEVLRSPLPSGSTGTDAQTAAVLRELDEDSGKEVLVDEGMVEVESSFVPL